jgi:cytidyltransferase-like protein
MHYIGYCALAADILHIGHIRFIKKASKLCKRLVVGVMTDKAIIDYKGKPPIISYKQRKEIIDNIKGVWKTVPQDSFNFKADKRIDVYFDTEEHKRYPASIFFKRTRGVSSTDIKKKIKGDVCTR